MSDKEVTVLTVRLPITIRNGVGKELATIYMTKDGQFSWHHSQLEQTTPYYPFDTLDECIKDVFSRCYDQVQALQKRSEEYRTLQDALRASLSTPWNKL